MKIVALIDHDRQPAPSATADNNYLYLAFNGYQSDVLHIKRFTKSGELNLISLYFPEEVRSNASPAIGIMPDGLPAVIYNKNRDSNGISKYSLRLLKCSGQSTTQMTWLAPTVVCNGVARTRTDWGASVCCNSELFVVFWKGQTDNRIYYTGCDSNRDWTLQYNIPSARTYAVPGVCTINSKVAVLFKGQSTPYLYISKGVPVH
ncbi:MAG: hypothetical protein GX556_13805 [Fibrobacter sp.]|nr:hypothetical protein [Fibrobacter sp.]